MLSVGFCQTFCKHTSAFTPWDPLDTPLDPWDPLDTSLDSWDPLDIPLDPWDALSVPLDAPLDPQGKPDYQETSWQLLQSLPLVVFQSIPNRPLIILSRRPF